MKSNFGKRVYKFLVYMLIVMVLLTACGGGTGGSNPTETTEGPPVPGDPETGHIGDIEFIFPTETPLPTADPTEWAKWDG